MANGWAVLAEKNDCGDIDLLDDLPVDFIDPSRLRQVLEDAGWAPDHIRELHDFDRETLADGLDWLAANADEDDIVFVYVGAHGGFYWPEETVGLDPMSRIRTDMLKWDQFFPVEWKQIPSHRQVLVTDSCLAARYTSVISDDLSPYISVAAVAGDEGIWWGLEEEGLPIIGSVLTHYFSAALGDPEADTDANGLISVQEAASLAEAQQRAYMHDVVLTVPRFVESFHQVGVSPEKDPAYPHVVVDDAIGKPLYLALDAYP